MAGPLAERSVFRRPAAPRGEYLRLSDYLVARTTITFGRLTKYGLSLF